MSAQPHGLSLRSHREGAPAWADPGAAIAVTFRGRLTVSVEQHTRLGLGGSMDGVYALRSASGLNERDIRGLSWMSCRPRTARTADGRLLAVLLPDDPVKVCARLSEPWSPSPQHKFFELAVRWLRHDTGELPFLRLPRAGDDVTWVAPEPGGAVRPKL